MTKTGWGTSLGLARIPTLAPSGSGPPRIYDLHREKITRMALTSSSRPPRTTRGATLGQHKGREEPQPEPPENVDSGTNAEQPQAPATPAPDS